MGVFGGTGILPVIFLGDSPVAPTDYPTCLDLQSFPKFYVLLCTPNPPGTEAGRHQESVPASCNEAN